MRDLLVVTPSRGRAGRLREMISATLSLSRAATDVAVAVDDNDPDLAGYRELAGSLAGESRVLWYSGPRQTVSGWTNRVALERLREYRAFASFGDDHMPRTDGWDKLLLGAIDAMGGTGIAYGADGIMETLATAPVISSDIVGALGWMCLPDLDHYCIDNVWGDLGRGAGCFTRCPDVLVEHLHPAGGKGAWDDTYADAGGFRGGCADEVAYLRWQQERMDADVAAVKALMS